MKHILLATKNIVRRDPVHGGEREGDRRACCAAPDLSFDWYHILIRTSRREREEGRAKIIFFFNGRGVRTRGRFIGLSLPDLSQKLIFG